MRARAEDRCTCCYLRLSGCVTRGVMLDQCCNGHQCCNGALGYLLLQVNVICLLIFLIGTTAIVKHPDWFGGVAAVTQSVAER